MKIYHLVASELKRLTASSMAKLALVALMAVPILYAGLYLWANNDPYGNLKDVPVALVVEDTGSTLDGKAVNYGDDVRDQLLDDASVGWQVVDADQAATGVRDGEFDFVLTLGADFSNALTSASGNSPTQAQVVLTTNDTNSFLATTIAGQVAEKVRASITERVGKEAALKLLDGFATVRSNLTEAVDGATKLADGADSAASGAATLADGAGSANDGAAQLTGGLQQLQAGSADLPAQANALNDGEQQLSAGLEQLRAGSASLPADAAALNDGAQQVSAGATTLDAGLQKLATASAGLPASTAELNDGAQQVAAGNAQLADTSTQIAAAVQDAADQVPAARAEIVALLNDTSLTEAQKADILAQLDAVGTAIDDGNEQVQTINGQIGQLADGSAQVAAGTQQLADSAPTLSGGIADAAAGSAAVASGAAQVAAGTQRLADKAPTLANGIAASADGAAQLAAGTQQLADQAPALSGGIASAASGSSTLSAGLGRLATGSADLSTGLSTLDDGAGTLRDGLASGLDDVPNQTADQREAAAQTISDPVALDSSAVTKASNYGAGMAPFFISLAAWIGIYALFLIVKPLSRRAVTAFKKPATATIAGWGAPALLGAVQMVAVFGIITLALGYQVEHGWGMLGFMILTSATFATIILALNILLGSVGQFLGLVLMVLQLVTAGGTFPWQTLPGPLQVLHNVLPMSHAVDGIRQLMYGGNLATAGADAGALVFWLIGALLVSYLGARRLTRHRTLRDLRPSLIG